MISWKLSLVFLLLPVAGIPQVDVSPVTPVRIMAAFRAPTTAFGPGHRGVDLVASLGQSVSSPISGVISFRGEVAGRPVLTLNDGVRTVTLEPVSSSLKAGTPVFSGQFLGTVGVGGHCSLRCVHLGLRVAGEYRNPLRLHARLLP
jgi:murein DD-endopeptidase MepM/ murein hydrolase activator NlpD